MLRVVVLANASDAKLVAENLPSKDYKIVAQLTPNEYDNTIQQKYKPDLIVTNYLAITNLLQAQRKESLTSRQQVKAVTHQGIRLVPVANVYYFQAEHKYVTAYHTQGQLLIEDSLNSLEREFSNEFIRIHRKTLVAKNHVENLFKNEEGQYYVKLRGRDEALNVSRRQLSQLRSILKWQ